MSFEKYEPIIDRPRIPVPGVVEFSEAPRKIEITDELAKTIEDPAKSINKRIFWLLADNPNLLYEIKSKINKIPKKENQLFSVCWVIAWETEKYFRNKDSKFYEEELWPLLSEYILCVNQAKQKLNDLRFHELYYSLIRSIEVVKVEKKQTRNRRTFHPSYPSY